MQYIKAAHCFAGLPFQKLNGKNHKIATIYANIMLLHWNFLKLS